MGAKAVASRAGAQYRRDRIDLMGVAVDAVSLTEALDSFRWFIDRHQPALVFNVNVDTWMKLREDEEFRAAYDAADLVLVDGTPLVWVSRILRTPLPGRVSGSDFFPAFCEVAAKEGYRVFLLGARPGIAEQAGSALQRQYPGLIVTTHSPSFGFERDEVENGNVIELVRRWNPDVLFVALGQPRQEKWLFRFRRNLNVPVAMGVGSSLDYLAGRLRRAPSWMQRAGLEWLYRLRQEPFRLWRRYVLDDSRIVYYVVREYLRRISRQERE